MRVQLRKKCGVTLIEIITVLVIVGILAGVVYTVWFTNWFALEDRIARVSMWEEANVIVETLTSDARYARDISITGGNKIATLTDSLGNMIATYTITPAGKFQVNAGAGSITQDLSSQINYIDSQFTPQGRGMRLDLAFEHDLPTRTINVETATEIFPRN